MTTRAEQVSEFLRDAGWASATRQTIAGDASNRRYDRLTLPDGRRAILMDAPPEKGEDVRPFVKIARFLVDQRLSAPQIFRQNATLGFLLIEDLGDGLFYDLIADDPALETPLYRAATDALIHLHAAPPLPLPHADADWLVDATGLFFEWYLDGDAVTRRSAFNAAFRPLADAISSAEKVVILRDFHAQNLIWMPERTGVQNVGLLDFQDALLGHPAYDLVSMLQDARRDVSAQTEREILDYYLTTAPAVTPSFEEAYATLGLQRNLRILGIFARLCLRDGKPAYVDMIPRVWRYIMRNLSHPHLAALSDILTPHLPEPTPNFLKELKSRCAPPTL